MRAIADGMDAAVVAAVDERVAAIAEEHGVRLPWVIESGSRAWGFPSPDSDYDCRFLYLRSRDDYLALHPPRDVIETPIDSVFDVSGWDVGKALRLTLKGNPTMLEWLRSPVVYSGDAAVRDALLTVAGRVLDRGAVGRHHLHVARLHLERSGTSLKRFLYALRPAATLRWLEVHPGSALPPMDLPTLLSEGDVPEDVHAAAAELIALKAVTRETGNGAVPQTLDTFVRHQLERAAHFETTAPAQDRTASRRLADETFRALLA